MEWAQQANEQDARKLAPVSSTLKRTTLRSSALLK